MVPMAVMVVVVMPMPMPMIMRIAMLMARPAFFPVNVLLFRHARVFYV